MYSIGKYSHYFITTLKNIKNIDSSCCTPETNIILSSVQFSRSVVSDSLQLHGLYNPPGSSVHGTFQARIFEWVAMPSSRGSLPNSGHLHLLHWQADSLPLAPPGKASEMITETKVQLYRLPTPSASSNSISKKQ